MHQRELGFWVYESWVSHPDCAEIHMCIWCPPTPGATEWFVRSQLSPTVVNGRWSWNRKPELLFFHWADAVINLIYVYKYTHTRVMCCLVANKELIGMRKMNRRNRDSQYQVCKMTFESWLIRLGLALDWSVEYYGRNYPLNDHRLFTYFHDALWDFFLSIYIHLNWKKTCSLHLCLHVYIGFRVTVQYVSMYGK